jgi:hypothetical protein
MKNWATAALKMDVRRKCQREQLRENESSTKCMCKSLWGK